MKYMALLKKLHNSLSPANYVEIGIRKGASIRLAKKFAIGIDPRFNITNPLSTSVKLFRCTSDDFFANYDLREELYRKYVELSFIDGLHLFEYALRDFRNIEKYSRKESIIIVDDIKPRNEVEAAREFPGEGGWTGDVWKLYYCLKEFRPDLKLFLLGTEPTGLLFITGIDPNSKQLWNHYDSILEKFLSSDYSTYPPASYFESFLEPEEFLKSDDFTQISAEFTSKFAA